MNESIIYTLAFSTKKKGHPYLNREGEPTENKYEFKDNLLLPTRKGK